MYRDKIVLITGGTGSWGNELTKQLLKQMPKEIRIFSRGELAQIMMQRRFNDSRIKFVIGDIRDKEAVEKVTKGVDYVFHLAALKHVPICENQPQEAIKTNIGGTTNLIEACLKNKVSKMVDVSTDKAVAPHNVYGMTKGIGEKLCVAANNLEGETQFICIRSGNVLGSSGSIVPLFISQIQTNNEVTLTDEKMTRYFFSIQEAIGLLFEATKKGVGGEIFVMKMPSCRIIDLAKVLIAHYGNEKTKIKLIGIRGGEKLHEELVAASEMSHTYEYDENYYLIVPTVEIEGFRAKYNQYEGMAKIARREVSLKDQMMDEEAIRQMLGVGGFIDDNK